MSSKQTTLAIALASVAALASQPAAASRINLPRLKKAFAAMERAMTQKNEPLFAKRWDPRGYKKNLVGGSGIPGKAVFRQGARKGWTLRPELKKARFVPGQLAGPVIVPCAVWSHRKGRAVDAVHALLIGGKKGYLVLGAGERLEEVLGLAKRYVAKQDLAPPKRSR